MAKIVVIGVGTTGIRVTEPLQPLMPDADFVAVGHFAVGETSTIPTRVNTRLKGKLTDDELCKYETEICKLKSNEEPGDTYWWYRSKGGPGYPSYMDTFHSGIALVRGQDIISSISTALSAGIWPPCIINPFTGECRPVSSQ